MLLVLSLQLGIAQNLIPDSSFEKNKFIPMDFSALNASYSWSIPSWGTSDLFCKCDRKTKESSDKIYSEVDVPQNTMGYQYPHSGTCYAGIFVFSHGNYREYLQTALKEPLKKNKTYLFTMYISLADYSRISIDQLGVCFLTNKADYHSSDVITDLSPVYINIEHEVGNDVKDWHRVTATYKSHGGESYLLFGSFDINKIKKTKLSAPKEIKSRINQKIERDAYYFIDDVSLVETSLNEQMDTTLNSEQEPAKTISPDSLFVLKNVLFNTNETILLPPSYPELNVIVEYLKKNPQTHIEIFGHTDNSGNETANKKLSTGRAKAVASYLISGGIDKDRIKYNGYGSLKPIATNNTEEGKQQNRRVEFIINKE
ncbi:MAG: OmpA family protein [Bacteroidota bacterium]